MQSFRLIITTTLLAASLGMHSASALEVSQTTGTNIDSSSHLSDPDDNIPFPHMADDDGQAAQLQSSQGNGPMSFGFSPSNTNPDAFERAQMRMQQ